jgi:hypothetical protein
MAAIGFSYAQQMRYPVLISDQWIKHARVYRLNSKEWK